MRRLPSAGQVGLSPVVEGLLVEVVEDGFTLYRCGPKTAPTALIACYEWEHYADLLTIRDFDRVITARVPAPGDIFAPEVVVWAYQGPPQHAIRALLTLVHPAHPDAPDTEYPAPAGLRVPRGQQRPMTIQLPIPRRAGTRAARLTAAMTTHGPGWSPVENEQPPGSAPGGQPFHPPAADNSEVHHAHPDIPTGSGSVQRYRWPSRRTGEVIGRGPDVLYVRFEGRSQVLSVSPRLVRLIPDKPDERRR